jgi:hypothetical protein
MEPARTAPEAARTRVGWWFAAAIILHALAWTAWFTIAARHPVAEVPLAAAPRR